MQIFIGELSTVWYGSMVWIQKTSLLPSCYCAASLRISYSNGTITIAMHPFHWSRNYSLLIQFSKFQISAAMVSVQNGMDGQNGLFYLEIGISDVAGKLLVG